MARTRKTSKEALEEKIEKAEADVIAAKKKYDQATANLKELLDKRDAIRKEEILSAVNNPVPVSLLSGDRKPQIRFLGNHHSGSGNLYHKSFRM